MRVRIDFDRLDQRIVALPIPRANFTDLETGAKGRGLFHPLRLALTGRGDGPELKKLLPLIGRVKALARLEGKTA